MVHPFVFHKLLLKILFSIFPLFLSLSLFASEKIQLNYWYFTGNPDLMKRIKAGFEKDNPGIQLNIQQLTWDNGFDKIIISFAANNEPDVLELGNTWVSRFASAGVLMKLNGEFEEISNKYVLWEPNIYQNNIYGVPWLLGSRVLFYNKTLFKKAGLNPEKPPETWDELIQYSKKISSLGKGYFGFGISAGEVYLPWQHFLPFVWGNHGSVLKDNNTRADLRSKEFIEALYFYRQIKPYALISRGDALSESFISEQKLGMFISGGWNLLIIPNKNPLLQYGVALVPKPGNAKGYHSSFAGGESLVISRNTRNREAAVRFIQYLISGSTLGEIIRYERSVLPALKSLSEDPYFDQYPNQKVIYRQLLQSQSAPAHPRWEEIQEHLSYMLDTILYDKAGVEQAADDADAKINRILSEEQKMGTITNATISQWIAIIIIALFLLSITAVIRNLTIRKQRVKNTLIWYLFLLPWAALFFAFSLYPLLYSVILSLTKFNLLSGSALFAGTGNYWKIITSGDFLLALFHTLIFAAGTIPFTITLALSSALLISKMPLQKIFQGSLFIPSVTSVIVIASMFSYIYADNGILNFILSRLNIKLPQPSWLMNTSLALPAIMAMNVWSSFGYYTILFLAGIKQIPDSLYEASSIDGAGNFKQMLFITIPLLKPVIFFVLVINTIRTLQVFPEIFAMTQGGPLGSTTTVVYLLYQKGFHNFELGEASAIAYILFFIILIFTLLQSKLLKDNT